MFAKGQTIIQFMEEFAPKSLAMPEDSIGLQLGSLQKEVRRVLITLDITEAVVQEAIHKQVDLIIAHHAIIFKPLRHLQTDTPAGQMIERLIKHDISVYISHTNLDVTEGGVNDVMAQKLQLEDLKVLVPTGEDRIYKAIVYIPTEYKAPVLQAMFAAGAGTIGDYSHCSFQMNGEGSFLPESQSTPFIGKQGEMERVEEVRAETIVPYSKLKKVIQAMKKVHPYEEPAYDVYLLEMKGKTYGLGRTGKLAKPMSLKDFTGHVKQAYEIPQLRLVGDPDRIIKKVALLGGMGSKYMKSAIFAGADVYITGDIDFHTAHDALAAGLALIDPGHHVEKVIKTPLAERLEERCKNQNYQTEFIVSDIHTEPFTFV